MTRTPYARSLRRVAAAAFTGLAMLSSTLPTQAAPWANRTQFARPVFQEVWAASDSAVAAGRAARSYTWGPAPWFDYNEFYHQSPNGLRPVQYFDKARMELNNPQAAPRQVTNGLLTVELVSGRVKVGDAIDDSENLRREPAQVPVAGDPGAQNPTAPTYASFRGVATVDNGYRDPDRSGQRVDAVLDKAGNRTSNATLGQDAATTIVTYNTVTGHNIPRVFRDFINNGPVDGLFAFGLPITDPYWVRARVGGQEKDILVQLYERRIVTYTPSNPAAYRVEMGNVGQHYFQWRYPHLGQPWLPNAEAAFTPPLAYASTVNGHWETFISDVNGNGRQQITSGTAETVPYSWRRSFVGGDTPRLMTDSRRNRGDRLLYSIDLAEPSRVRQHSNNQYAKWQHFNGAVSPDGTLIAMALEQTEYGPDNTFKALGIQPFDQTEVFPSYFTGNNNCVYQSPSWLPDGSGLVYAANCSGKFAIYRADLRYEVMADAYVSAQLVNVRAITNTPTVDNYFPRVSPDGSKVVFSSNRNGQGDIYVLNIDGTGERRLTSDAADDGAATWSPDGREIIFDSNRDGDYDLYRMRIDNTAVVTQLTNNSIDDRWPIWFQ